MHISNKQSPSRAPWLTLASFCRRQCEAHKALSEPYLEPPRTPRSPCRTSWNPGTFMEPYLAKPGRIVVELSWNLTSNHPGPPCSPGGALVEPSLNQPGPPRSPRRNWWNRGGTLVEPYLKPPRTTPQPLQNPGETLVEPYLKPPRNPCRTWWNPGGSLADGGTLVEPWWNPGGTLVELWWNHPGAYLG